VQRGSTLSGVSGARYTLRACLLATATYLATKSGAVTVVL